MRMDTMMASFRRFQPYIPLMEAAMPVRSLLFSGAVLRRAAQAPHPLGFCVWLPAMQKRLGEALYLSVPGKILQQGLVLTVPRGERALRLRAYFVGYGDWGRLSGNIQHSSIFQEMKAVLECDGQYRESPWYQQRVAELGKGRFLQRHGTMLASAELLDDYMQGSVAIYRSVREYGLLRQQDVHKSAIHTPSPKIRSEKLAKLEVGMGAAIGPKGEIFRTADAQHRSSLAVLLDLKAVPVDVRMIHGDWLRTVLQANPSLSPTRALVKALGEVQERCG
jgi:hypothetical protein